MTLSLLTNLHACPIPGSRPKLGFDSSIWPVSRVLGSYSRHADAGNRCAASILAGREFVTERIEKIEDQVLRACHPTSAMAI